MIIIEGTIVVLQSGQSYSLLGQKAIFNPVSEQLDKGKRKSNRGRNSRQMKGKPDIQSNQTKNYSLAIKKVIKEIANQCLLGGFNS